ncbi:hypothetical protein AM588_10005210 [Phytophthora nicotianae]|uniref:RxLR effector protein n=1 Tax=Phytophthora nicotianae TaxID=4792 RepID=A0A0W8CZW7_PHYNI|nr:hypothetical protein AM588_10005210 [Phytophthora nicotianae]
MRVYFIFLLVATTLAACTSALLTSMDSRRVTDTTSVVAPQSSTIKENGTPANYLRKKESKIARDEERGFTSKFSSVGSVLEGMPSLASNKLLGGFNKLPRKDQAEVLKKLASLERMDVALATNQVPYWISNWVGRIMQYNAWIWSKKTPEWVMKEYPAFAKSYDLFYHNRMTRGYKYA